MTATLVIVLLWIGFAATHSGLSSVGVRQRIVDRLGERAFLGAYSAVSFAFFVPLVWVYFANKHAGPLLWSVTLGPAGRWLLYIGIGVAFTLVVAGLMQPSPASMAGGKAEVRGVFRLTRHPMFMGFGLLGLLHLIPNGHASDVAFFGGLPVYALFGCRHQDQRKLVENAAKFQPFFAATPFLPFTGRETALGIRELFPKVIGLGVAVTIVIRYFHPSLFGG